MTSSRYPSTEIETLRLFLINFSIGYTASLVSHTRNGVYEQDTVLSLGVFMCFFPEHNCFHGCWSLRVRTSHSVWLPWGIQPLLTYFHLLLIASFNFKLQYHFELMLFFLNMKAITFAVLFFFHSECVREPLPKWLNIWLLTGAHPIMENNLNLLLDFVVCFFL